MVYTHGNQIYYNYALKSENGFKVPRAYNVKVIGASLKGTILEPMNDVIKVSVSEDEKQEGCRTRCFRSSSASVAMELADIACQNQPISSSPRCCTGSVCDHKK